MLLITSRGLLQSYNRKRRLAFAEQGILKPIWDTEEMDRANGPLPTYNTTTLQWIHRSGTPRETGQEPLERLLQFLTMVIKVLTFNLLKLVVY